MPASRRARAMILAPRSCPSSPGFAIKTRIFFSGIWNLLCPLAPDPLQEILDRYENKHSDEEIDKNQANEAKGPAVQGFGIIGAGHKHTLCGLEYDLKYRQDSGRPTVSPLNFERRSSRWRRSLRRR